LEPTRHAIDGHGSAWTLAFLAGLRNDRVVTPGVIDGPANGAFTAWVGQFLAPTISWGDIVIADNLGSYKGNAVRDVIRGIGAKLFFLPAYSPDPNPIEKAFTKLKMLL
jgi:transposase